MVNQTINTSQLTVPYIYNAKFTNDKLSWLNMAFTTGHIILPPLRQARSRQCPSLFLSTRLYHPKIIVNASNWSSCILSNRRYFYLTIMCHVADSWSSQVNSVPPQTEHFNLPTNNTVNSRLSATLAIRHQNHRNKFAQFSSSRFTASFDYPPTFVYGPDDGGESRVDCTIVS